MQASGLVKDLAALERELSGRLEEAHRSAEHSIARAQEEARRIMAEAEAQVRQMADVSRSGIAEQSDRIAAQALTRAESEAQGIREQAEPNMDRAVNFILSRVVP